VLGEQLATALEALVAGLKFRETNDLLDAGGKALGEGWVGNDILDATLGVGSDHTDTERGRCVERVRDADLAGLQAVLVHHMLLSGENEPDCFILGRAVLVIGVIVANESLLGGGLLLFLLSRLDVLQQRGGSFEGLIGGKISTLRNSILGIIGTNLGLVKLIRGARSHLRGKLSSRGAHFSKL
jgi:hypothetical protein